MQEKIIVGVTDAAVSRRAVDWATERATIRGDRLELVSIVGGAAGVIGEGRDGPFVCRRRCDMQLDGSGYDAAGLN